MRALTDWIVQIGCLALIAGVVELLLPNNSTRGAVRLVVGLVVILIIVEPVVRWVGDPAAIDRLSQGVLAEDGRRYIAAGVRLAEESAHTVATGWAGDLERQLAAVASLVWGVRDVGVEVTADGSGVTGVEVSLEVEAGAWETSSAGVRRLVESFLPGVHPSAIVIMER